MRACIDIFFVAMLLLSPGADQLAQAGEVLSVQQLALVYARNSSDVVVALYVDGRYQGQVDARSWSTLSVEFGEHVFSWSDGAISASIRYDVTVSPWNWHVGQ